ncbi:MAG: hypothetical protein WCP08_08875 [Prolixibacteraceae bacterium]
MYFTHTDCSKSPAYGFSKFNPQLYYLYQDGVTGTYLSTTLSLNKNNFPFPMATMLNQPIHTDIPAGNKLVWNVRITYAFNKK